MIGVEIARKDRTLESPSPRVDLSLGSQFRGYTNYLVDARRHPRFSLDVGVCVYPRGTSVVRGHTVDISESGVGLMLRDEIPVGEVVRLEFTVPLGSVDVHALVCHRNAFRYGLQFVESATAQDVIGRTCRQLALDQALKLPKQS